MKHCFFGISSGRNPGSGIVYLIALLCMSLPVFAQPISFGEKPAAFSAPQIPTEKPPRLLEQLDVEYPANAYKNGIEGITVISAYIDAKGYPAYGEVSQSSGNRELDSVAIHAVRNGNFKAAWYKGNPVGARLTVPVEFRLPHSQDWSVDKNTEELQDDMHALKRSKEAIDDKMRELEEEIRQLRAKQDSIKNSKQQ